MSKFYNPYHFVPIPSDATSPGCLNLVRDANQRLEGFQEEASHLTHDRYAPDTLSGRIVCDIETVTPIFCGNKQEKRKGQATKVRPFELEEGVPAIPASSIKGMLSSLIEAASHSACRVLADTTYSVRDNISGESMSAIGILVKEDGELKLRPLTLPTMPLGSRDYKKKAGIERYMDLFPAQVIRDNVPFSVYIDGYQIQNGKITPRHGTFLAGHPTSNSSQHRDWYYLKLQPVPNQPSLSSTGNQAGYKIKNGTFLLGRQAARHPQRPDKQVLPISHKEYEKLTNKSGYMRGYIRVFEFRGHEDQIPTGKHHELFIPCPPESEEITALPLGNCLQTFHELADQRTAEESYLPFAPRGTYRNSKGQVRLDDGDLVYFELDKEGEVSRIALSATWRRKIEDSAHKFFGEAQVPFHSSRTTLTLAEQLFGFVEVDHSGKQLHQSAMAGRLRFTDAKLKKNTEFPYDKEITLKILSSPKPPCPALYFKQKEGETTAPIPKSKLDSEKHAPQGRKVYLHARDRGSSAKANSPTENFEQKLEVRPIRSGVTFRFEIDFDNLSRTELQFVSYVLQPAVYSKANTTFHHKIGLGKPLGLGSIRLSPVAIGYINRKARYSVEGLSSPRFNEVWRDETNESQPVWAEETNCRDELTFPKLRSTCRKTMTKNKLGPVHQALYLFGNPESTADADVHYPFKYKSGHAEDKNFEWFKGEQFLKPISGKPGESIVPLDTKI